MKSINYKYQTKEINEEIKGFYDLSVISIINDKNKEIGTATLGISKKNLFIDKNGKPEMILLGIYVDNDYGGEGIEGVLVDLCIQVARKNERVLLTTSTVYEKWGKGTFFERRGFKFQPVVFMEDFFLYGEDFLYNLSNIEELCYPFLEKENGKTFLNSLIYMHNKKTEEVKAEVKNEEYIRYFDIHVFQSRKNGFSVYVGIPKSVIGNGNYIDEDLVLEYAIKEGKLEVGDAKMVDSIDELSKAEYEDMIN